MEVVLQEDFPALGYVGDKVKVRGGYARNFLLPRGIAVEATSPNAKYLRHRLTQILAKKAKLKAAADEEAKKYAELVLEFTLKIGEKGKSFGTVSIRDIELALEAKNLKVDRKQIRILEPIKSGGDHGVEIKLHSEVVIPVIARVTVERLEKKAAAEGEGKGRRSRGRKKSKDSDAPETEEGVAAEVTGETPSSESAE